MITLFTDKKDCCGCTACMNICPKSAITMHSDKEGFLYPTINNSKCIECNLCKKVCSFQDGNNNEYIDNKPNVYAVKHKDQGTRMDSTSGGIFTALSDFVLGQNGVIFGASFTDDMQVYHEVAYTKQERDRFRGSKYVQSDLKNIFKQVRELVIDRKYILFTGTPCQIAGLNSYLKDVNKDTLILCDIVCHGTPSPRIWKDYLKYISDKQCDNIIDYRFRDKSIGWHGINISAEFRKGKVIKNTSLLKTYSNLYFSNVITRPACHNCKYTCINRESDITIADFWGIEKIMPEFYDNQGVSLVLVHSPKGQDVFEEISSNLEIRKSNTKDCLQPQLQFPSKESPRRQEFWKDYSAYGFEYVIKKYAGYNMRTRIKAKIINILKKIGLFGVVHKVLRR